VGGVEGGVRMCVCVYSCLSVCVCMLVCVCASERERHGKPVNSSAPIVFFRLNLCVCVYVCVCTSKIPVVYGATILFYLFIYTFFAKYPWCTEPHFQVLKLIFII